MTDLPGTATPARRATGADADELVRLRQVMFTDMSGHPAGDGWQRPTREIFRTRLDEPDPSLVAFVVDWPERPGMLAACAVGSVDFRLGGPRNPTGESGHVYNVVTERDCRRRGYARACVTALVDWFTGRGITTVGLRATADGEPLYRSLGFVRLPDPAMRLNLGDR